MRWLLTLFLTSLLVSPSCAEPVFKLAPAVALEAEDFHVESGWKVIRNGHGNYMVDIIGFNHISGERLLGLDARDDKASAFHDITVPEAGPYRLWVRYEYPAFCETRFRVVVMQDGKTILDRVLGTKDSRRYAFGAPYPKAQHDPAWGPEGLMEEAVAVPALKAGKARIYLKGVAQPQTPGVAAHRNIDLLYLTRDTSDAWLRHYRAQKQNTLYPILDVFRDTRGPRYEVRFTNKGSRSADYHVVHVYNRVPWGAREPRLVRDVAVGKSSDWLPLRMQDTAHFSLVQFTSNEPFAVELRPLGGAVERRLSGSKVLHVYLPAYPGKGEKPITPEEEIDAVLDLLKRTPIIGKKPTQPLCYGGWLPLGQDNDYGRKYAQLYAALGFRALHPAFSGPAVRKNLEAAGIPLSKSWMAAGYRNPPTEINIEKAQKEARRLGLQKSLKWFDYGDEIAFSEWLDLFVQAEVARVAREGQKVNPEQVVAGLWGQWLRKNRPNGRPVDYWRKPWGPFNLARLRPDSSAAAAAENPRLYVDSVLFYEDMAIRYAARGAKAVKKALGADVLCGANYSGHPFYYPHSAMYIKWFREGAADMGRHSEYFWQVAQAGPMINGYFAEHFLCGMRNNPKAVLRQYTMPHSPGNTEASFLRSAFTHLAHGATALDFFGIGMNETFTENHIDHRDHERYRVLRDVTHAVGFIEDLLPGSRPVPSPVALLVSASTERWDLAGVATDRAGHDLFGTGFRKARLNNHIERLGLWTALTFLGVAPDLVVEEDLTAKALKDYKVLVVVGDCLPPEQAAAVKEWVRGGGVLLATANAGRYDAYHQPTAVWADLFGLLARRSEERTSFFRPRQELPFLKPLDRVAWSGVRMPQLATYERIVPLEGVGIKAYFKKDDSPAILDRRLGKGRVYYVAALPGVAYLWSALQPPQVPDRGPGTHTVPTAFDVGAHLLLKQCLEAASIEPQVAADSVRIDRRLLKSKKGYILPLANYEGRVGQKVTVTIRLAQPIHKVTSAYHGILKHKQKDGKLRVTLPALGYGDVLRLEP